MKLFRKMFAAEDGRPKVGSGRNELGVRPADPTRPKKAADVRAVTGNDQIQPGEGLSTFDDPAEIPPQVSGVMWVIETERLPPVLCQRQRGKPHHHHIEPVLSAFTLDQFQQLLAATRELWEPLDLGASS